MSFPFVESEVESMSFDRTLHHRRSLRLKEYDYSWAGWYYVTICTKQRVRVLGKIHDDSVKLSAVGEIVQKCWTCLTSDFHTVELDEYVIMPNHLHGIIILGDSPRRGLINQTPTQEKSEGYWQLMKNPDLKVGKIMRHFKAKASKLIHDAGFGSFAWQRNYHDHIIRNDADLTRIRQYIRNNPLKWALDEENPDHINTNTFA